MGLQVTRRQLLKYFGVSAITLSLPSVSQSQELSSEVTLEQKVEIPFSEEKVTRGGRTFVQYSLEPGYYGIHTTNNEFCEPLCQIDSANSRLIIRPLHKPEKLQNPVYRPKERKIKPIFKDNMQIMEADVLSRAVKPWYEFKPGIYGLFVINKGKEIYLCAIDTREDRLNVYKTDSVKQDFTPVLRPRNL